MANRTYLVGHNGSEPPVSFTTDQLLLEAPYHVPLLWLACVDVSEAKRIPTRSRDGTAYDWCGASFLKADALARLCQRQPVIAGAFAHSGDLTYHINLFSGWLQQVEYSHLSINWTDYACLNEGDHELVISAIAEAASPCISPSGPLVTVSTVMPDTRFLTLDQARQGFTQDEMANFFRLFGESYTRPVPWR
jgi:hypothetical protein